MDKINLPNNSEQTIELRKSFPEVQAKLKKLSALVNVKQTLDPEDHLVLREALDWLKEWGEEQERHYEEVTGEPFPKLNLRGLHD